MRRRVATKEEAICVNADTSRWLQIAPDGSVSEKPFLAFAFEGGYHGRTLGASSITSSYRYRERFGHFGDRANFIPYPYCFRCHLDKRGEVNLPNAHPVIAGKVTCADCHDPHKGKVIARTGASLETPNETCTKCHTSQRSEEHTSELQSH